MAYAKATLIQRIRQVLDDNPWYDTCTEAMDTTEVGLDVTDGTKYAAGMVLEFQDDGELCLVQSISSNTLTVVRNYKFSVTATVGTGTSHSSSAIFSVDPSFRYDAIVEAIRSVLAGLWPYVYREVNYTLTPNTDGNRYYELDDAASNSTVILDLSSVRQEINGTAGAATTRIFSYGDPRNKGAYPVALVFNAPTAKVGSGVALYIPYLRNSTNSIYVNGIAALDDTYSAPNYTYLTAGVEVDCVVYLAAARLMRDSDVRRTMLDDVGQGETGQRPGVRAALSELYEQKGMEYRKQWQELLRVTLPRMPLGRWRSS